MSRRIKDQLLSEDIATLEIIAPCQGKILFGSLTRNAFIVSLRDSPLSGISSARRKHEA
jgi:hypothetical protein